MRVYKLTDHNYRTRNGTSWLTDGVEHGAPGGGPLCTDRWLHAYSHPLQAVLMAPVHRADGHPHLLECDADVGRDDGTKLGCTRIKRLREVPRARLTPAQRVRAAIYLALQVENSDAFQVWAKGWLDNLDRLKASVAIIMRRRHNFPIKAHHWVLSAAYAFVRKTPAQVAVGAARAAETAVLLQGCAEQIKVDLVGAVQRAIAEEPT